MSRSYTKISANKPPPVKKLVRPMPRMSSFLAAGSKGGFKPLSK